MSKRNQSPQVNPKRGKYIRVDSKFIVENEKRTNLDFQGRHFQCRKKSVEKKVGKLVAQYYSKKNKPCRCKDGIKKVFTGNEPPQFFVKVCPHEDDKLPSHPFYLYSLKESLTGKRKRTKFEDNPLEQSSINGILPSSGPLSGNNHVDIYFTISQRDGLARLTSGVNIIGTVRFGDKQAMGVGGVFKVEDYIRVNDFQEDQNYEKCSSSRFVIQAKVPAAEEFGPVDVSMQLLNGVITLPNGYFYQQPQGNDYAILEKNKLSSTDDQEFYDEYGFPIDKFEDMEGGFAYNEDDNLDLFDGNGFHYAVAKDRMDLVKHYLEKKHYNIFREDKFGFSAYTIAVHLKKQQILEYFESLCIVTCQICLENVKFDGRVVNHKCAEEGSRVVDHKNRSLGDYFKVYHIIENGKRHKADCKLITHRVCSGCGHQEKNISGDLKMLVGRKSFVVVSKM